MTDSDDSAPAARAERAAARSLWLGRLGRVEDLPDVELIEAPADVLVGMVRELTLAAWAMSGREVPDYPRSEAPGRVIRRSDPT